MELNYLTLKEKVYLISNRMFPQICIDMDKFENKQFNYYFDLVNEIYRGLSLCCVAIDVQAYSQIGTLLRQLLEQVAIAKIIGEDEKALSAYRIFAKARHYYIEHNNDDSQLKALFDKSTLSKKKIKKMDYYTIGWLELIGETEITYEKLFELAQIKDLIDYRKYYNNYVHTSLTFMALTQEGIIAQNSEFIYTLAILLDIICCSYHKVTKFDFKFGEHRLFSEFRDYYSNITQFRNNNSIG